MREEEVVTRDDAGCARVRGRGLGIERTVPSEARTRRRSASGGTQQSADRAPFGSGRIARGTGSRQGQPPEDPTVVSYRPIGNIIRSMLIGSCRRQNEQERTADHEKMADPPLRHGKISTLTKMLILLRNTMTSGSSQSHPEHEREHHGETRCTPRAGSASSRSIAVIEAEQELPGRGGITSVKQKTAPPGTATGLRAP